MKKPTYKGKELLPLSVIDAARDGDAQAVDVILPKTEYAKRDIWTADMIRLALDKCTDSKLYVAMKCPNGFAHGFNARR